MINVAPNICMAVLRRVQKGLERLHDGFARVQKGPEVSSRRFAFCQITINVLPRNMTASLTYLDTNNRMWLALPLVMFDIETMDLIRSRCFYTLGSH